MLKQVAKAKKPMLKKPKVEPKRKKPTFREEVEALKGKAMTDAARRAEANRIAKKYGKTRDEVLRPKAAKKRALTAAEGKKVRVKRIRVQKNKNKRP